MVARHLETCATSTRSPGAPASARSRAKILDADAGSVLTTSSTSLRRSVSRRVFDGWDNGQTKRPAKCGTVLATMEENLKGEFMTGVHVPVLAEFFRAHRPPKEVKTFRTGRRVQC